jgi:hypothetical protein
MGRLFAVALLLCGVSTGSAGAQIFALMPDPHLHVSDHYQTDAARPVQERLEDCFLFEALAWGRSMDDVRGRMLMACRHIAFRLARGADLDDRGRATEALMLTFEAAARDRMRRYDVTGGTPTGSLVLRTGWHELTSDHRRLIEDLGLDLVMETLFAAG